MRGGLSTGKRSCPDDVGGNGPYEGIVDQAASALSVDSRRLARPAHLRVRNCNQSDRGRKFPALIMSISRLC